MTPLPPFPTETKLAEFGTKPWFHPLSQVLQLLAVPFLYIKIATYRSHAHDYFVLAIVYTRTAL